MHVTDNISPRLNLTFQVLIATPRWAFMKAMNTDPSARRDKVWKDAVLLVGEIWRGNKTEYFRRFDGPLLKGCRNLRPYGSLAAFGQAGGPAHASHLPAGGQYSESQDDGRASEDEEF
eukprot:jgi/Mesvir1/7339/Mv19148-RA.1